MADNYSFKDASGNTVTHASEEISAGVHASMHVSVDDAGVAIAKAEDAAHSSGDKGIMLLAVRKDSATALAGSDGDYIPLIVDSSGRLHVTSSATAVAGDVAHDAADSGNPVKIGGKAATSAPTAVSAGDRVNAYFDANGRLVVNEDQLRALLPASIGVKAKAASLAIAVASDQIDADNASAVTNFPGLGGYAQDLTNTDSSGIAAGNVGRVRMTQQRELLVSPRARWVYCSGASVTNKADLLVSTTNAYSGYAGPTTAFFDGADAGFGATSRYIRIPMLEFTRGCTIGLYHNLGVDCTVTIRADITGANSSLSMQRPVIDSVIVASGATAFFTSFPLAAGADATMRYVPQLNMPMYYAIVQILPASDPSSGTLYIAVAR